MNFSDSSNGLPKKRILSMSALIGLNITSCQVKSRGVAPKT